MSDCGYHKAWMSAWQRNHRAFMVEFKRLAAIKILFRVFYYQLLILVWNCGIIKLRYVPGKAVIGLRD